MIQGLKRGKTARSDCRVRFHWYCGWGRGEAQCVTQAACSCFIHMRSDSATLNVDLRCATSMPCVAASTLLPRRPIDTCETSVSPLHLSSIGAWRHLLYVHCTVVAVASVPVAALNTTQPCGFHVASMASAGRCEPDNLIACRVVLLGTRYIAARVSARVGNLTARHWAR